MWTWRRAWGIGMKQSLSPVRGLESVDAANGHARTQAASALYCTAYLDLGLGFSLQTRVDQEPWSVPWPLARLAIPGALAAFYLASVAQPGIFEVHLCDSSPRHTPFKFRNT